MIETTQIASYLDKLEALLICHHGDSKKFNEALALLEDEFSHYIYPLIIPDPHCVFSYLCSILRSFKDLHSRKSFFETKKFTCPPTPGRKNKTDIKFYFQNCSQFLQGLNFTKYYLRHTEEYLNSSEYKAFLAENPAYESFLEKLSLFNLKKNYLQIKQKQIVKKNLKGESSIVNLVINTTVNSTPENIENTPSLAPLDLSMTKNSPRQSSSDDIDSNPDEDWVDEDCDTEILDLSDFNEYQKEILSDIAIPPNFPTPSPPLLSPPPASELSEELHTPYPIRYVFLFLLIFYKN